MAVRRLTSTLALSLGLLVLLFSSAAAQSNTTNPVAVPAGFEKILEVRASGYQIYKCVASGSSYNWTFQRAKAVLYSTDSKDGTLLGNHYFLPRSDGLGGRPSWELGATDRFPASTVTGRINGTKANGPGNIADLLLEATSQSGTGPLSQAAYIQRLNSQGGAPPSTGCSGPEQEGTIFRSRYTGNYVFSALATTPPPSEPATTPASPSQPQLAFFGRGLQHYFYNGSNWLLFNATADLFVRPGGSQVGRHYFLQKPDALGGQPTFELFMPASAVTGRVVQQFAVSPADINWLLLDTTATTGDGNRVWLGSVTHISRLSTKGGIPPPASQQAKTGDIFLSPYSAVYWFFA